MKKAITKATKKTDPLYFITNDKRSYDDRREWLMKNNIKFSTARDSDYKIILTSINAKKYKDLVDEWDVE